MCGNAEEPACKFDISERSQAYGWTVPEAGESRRISWHFATELQAEGGFI
jgi:hypothetical protein